jgi:signal transduction histidine kinase
MRTRTKRSVRTKIILLLLAPLITVLGLWVFAAGTTIGDARAQLRTRTILDSLDTPLTAVDTQLGTEMALSVVAMSTNGPAERKALGDQRVLVDKAIAVARQGVNNKAAKDADGGRLESRVEAFVVTQLGGLGDLRSRVDNSSAPRLQVLQDYFALVTADAQLIETIAQKTLVDVDLYQEAAQIMDGVRGIDAITAARTIVQGALLSGSPALTSDERDLYEQYTQRRRLLMNSAATKTDSSYGKGLVQQLASPQARALGSYENQIIGNPANTPLKIDLKAYGDQSLLFQTNWGNVLLAQTQTLVHRAQEAGRPVIVRLALAGGVGLLAVALSLFLSIRLGRGLTRELTGLQDAARDLANVRLPNIIERLRNDEQVDVAAEAPPLELGTTIEVARVGEAFTTVQRTAIDAAVGQAKLRQGVRQVFLNLARRSQSLLHRQLTMLDGMERKTADPDALEELFRLDHLTTRMRRHAEGLIILSGALPARAWSTPVRIVDVIRAAISEVENYERVRVYVMSEASLQGASVADLTHLIAELVENAANFSPPHTQVQVRAEGVSNGFVIEIEDAGLGMNPEQFDGINERLAEPPDFDLADTDRLGLFVVAQLAARHNIRITLRPSPYGGVSAIILVPAELMGQAALPGGGSADGRVRPAPAPEGQGEDLVQFGRDEAGRHRRIAGFMSRARELQSDPNPNANGNGNGNANGHGGAPGAPDVPRPRTPEWMDVNGSAGANGSSVQPGNGSHPPADVPAPDPWAGQPYPGQPYPEGSQYTEQPYGEQQYTDPRYAQQAYGQPGYGEQQHSADQYGQGQYSQGQYGPAQSQYAAPGYATPPPPYEPYQPGNGNGTTGGYGYDGPPAPAGPPAAESSAPPSASRGAGFDLWATSESSATSAGTHAGLPRRVRRASLAPQLRESPPPDESGEPDQERSPEQARALLSSLQHGWQRGRNDAHGSAPHSEENR